MTMKDAAFRWIKTALCALVSEPLLVESSLEKPSVAHTIAWIQERRDFFGCLVNMGG